MSAAPQIFFDPSGKRRKIARAAVFVALALIVAFYVVGEVIFLGSPLVISPTKHSPLQSTTAPRDVAPSNLPLVELTRSRDALAREIIETRALAKDRKASISSNRRTLFVQDISQEALSSMRAHAENLTAVSPAWLTIDAHNRTMSEVLAKEEINPNNSELRSLASEAQISIIPRFVAATESELSTFWSLSSDEAQQLAIHATEFLVREKAAGMLIDIQPGDQTQARKLAMFISSLLKLCRLHNKEVGIVTFIDSLQLLHNSLHNIDSLVLVNRFQRPTQGHLGSVTSFGDALQALQKTIPAEKITVAFTSAAATVDERLPTYAEESTFLAAMTEARSARIRFDPLTGLSSYKTVSRAGVSSQAWILDAPYGFNCKKIAEAGAVSQFGIWNIGGEDAGLWELLSPTPSAAELSVVPPTRALSSQGRGDILTVQLSGEAHGGRKLLFDDQSGLITEVRYESMPSAPTTLHSGFKEKRIALTFDDGPVEPYTSQILDLLKANNIKASFFVVGERVIENPDLLRRIYSEGHDIGNHSFSHPDLSLVSRHRVTLELNATQRAIQAVLGHSALLFRPPYISEGSPLSPSEFRVMSIAQDLGYTTVGISSNGRDWVRYEADSAGIETERTGEHIANEILSKIDLMSGNSILLHDGPSDREKTVEATAILIKTLRERGYTFSTVHELMGVSREALLPTISQNPLQLLHKTVLELVSYGSRLFSALFIMLVALGVVRLALILVCAILAKIKENKNPCSEADLERARDVPVSIVIAAYNEEKVIANTLQSLLKGNHRAFEIIVVDDGSQDATSTVVQEKFRDEPRVTLVRQANGGKSSALNHGITFATSDIIVCLDADTQFDANAVTYLARHFEDRSVGAVAGNIKVGNRRSILTHWQSMEYITNISIGRRAYSYLNAITVVAGAAGAWRRKALEEAGGYHSDSLAEDMDLTWRVRRLEYRVINEPLAIGYTESPEDFRSLYKQRFRWSYGALQCVWKHRSAIGKHGFFGWLGIPSIFIFGCVFELLAPLADLKMILGLLSFFGLLFSGQSIDPGSLQYDGLVQPMITTAVLYLIFFSVELMISVLAFYLDDEDMRPLWLLFFQRFAYRQLMYFVAWRALWKAITGWKQGWGTLQRTGTVTVPAA